MPGEVTFGLQADSSTNTSTTWKKLRSSSPFGKPPMSKEDIVAHGKCLCGQYIRSRLRRAGCLNRKVTQRLRTLVDPAHTIATRDIFPTLNAMCEELERMHPRIYTNVSRQLSRSPFGELADADAAPFLLHATAKELFKLGINNNSSAAAATSSDEPASSPIITTTTTTSTNNHTNAAVISWGKIVSLFAVCGALAVDIVRQGHYDYLPRLLEGTADIIDEDLAAWIQQQPSNGKASSLHSNGQQPHASNNGCSNGVNGGGGGGGGGCCGGGGGGGGGSWAGLVEHFQPPHVQPASVAEVVCSNWISVSMGGLVSVYATVSAVRWLSEWCCGLFGTPSVASSGELEL